MTARISEITGPCAFAWNPIDDRMKTAGTSAQAAMEILLVEFMLWDPDLSTTGYRPQGNALLKACDPKASAEARRQLSGPILNAMARMFQRRIRRKSGLDSPAAGDSSAMLAIVRGRPEDGRMTRRAKRVALACAFLGIGVFSAAGIALFPAMVDHWFIWRLGARDEAARRAAIEALGERRSRRAAPYLAEAYGKEASWGMRERIITALIRIDRLEED